MKLEPLNQNIVVKPLKKEENKSGIILPDNAKEKENKQQGKVIAVNSEEKIIKIGDIVIYAQYSGSEIKVSEVEYRIINTEEVLAKIIIKK